MRVLGIDVGLRGGLSLADTQRVILAEELPEMPLHTEDLVEIIKNWDVTHVYLEKAQSMPRQGVSSVFTYATGYGAIIGVVKTLKLPLRLVQPREWTREMHKGTTYVEPPKVDGKKSKTNPAKERSKEAALNLFPHMNFLVSPRSKKLHDGLIDSSLIAEFGRREQLGKFNAAS